MRFGAWNVRSLYSVGSPKKVASEIARYKLNFVVVQEVRWDKGGSQPADDYIFLYRSGNANRHLVGKSKGRDHSEDLGIDGRIIKVDLMEMWTEFM
jgi:hypothetical protein